MPTPAVHLTVITKPGCHLCVPAVEAVAQIALETGATWNEVDLADVVDPDPAWPEQVPVTLLNGEVHDIWRVRPARLRAAIHSAQGEAL